MRLFSRINIKNRIYRPKICAAVLLMKPNFWQVGRFHRLVVLFNVSEILHPSRRIIWFMIAQEATLCRSLRQNPLLSAHFSRHWDNRRRFTDSPVLENPIAIIFDSIVISFATSVSQRQFDAGASCHVPGGEVISGCEGLSIFQRGPAGFRRHRSWIIISRHLNWMLEYKLAFSIAIFAYFVKRHY